MRIVYVVEYFPPHVGGVETLFDNLTRGVARVHDVDVLTMAVPGAPRHERSHGRKIYRVDCSSRHAFVTKFAAAAKLMERADVVHTTTFVAAGTTWLANLLMEKPTVLTFHELWGKRFFEVQPAHKAFFNATMEALIRMFYRNATIVAPSTFSYDALAMHGVPPQNIHVVPHGIDHKAFNTHVKPFATFDDPTYIFFGRAGVTKGLEYLLDAVPLIADKMPKAKLLLMVSKDSDYRRVENKINVLVKEGRVVLIEPKSSQKEVASVIRSADVVCVPSLSEGFGFNAVEAQACGVPVVASHAGSLPEMVSGGLLVEPKNPRAIADAVVKLLSDNGLRKRLSSRGARFAKRFTWERSVKEHLKLYERVAG